MPVQDLTPQLRTRLSRVERTVGWFVILATLLLLGGFSYYVYVTAEHKGWFKIKVPYHTFVNSGAGLHVGDPVKLLGFDVGEIREITAMPPFSEAGAVYIEFIVQEPFYGYIWDDSKAKINTADFLGKRTVEIVQGGLSTNKNLHATYRVDSIGKINGVWSPQSNNYVAFSKSSKGYTLPADESPALGDRLEAMANQVEAAMPGVFGLTNYVVGLLTNATHLTVRADATLVETRPLLTNLATITALLTNGNGALGDWILPTNLNNQLQLTLASARSTMTNADTNVALLAGSLYLTLENLANITSNLNSQVQTNDQMLSQISSTVVTANDFLQGLKHHWLLRSAFKNEKQPATPPPQPPPRSKPPVDPIRGPR